MACNALAKAGVNVRIIDQRPAKVAAGQADGIQPRTIEIFQSYGLGERLLREGNQMHTAAFYNPSAQGGVELTDRVPDVTATSAKFPFEVTLHQGAIEDMFLDSMKSLGVEVERPIVPVSIQVSEDEEELGNPKFRPVKVTLRRLSGPNTGLSEVVYARFVIGADGAHSWVRKNLNVAMEGEQTDHVWGVIDILPDSDFPDIRNKTVVHSNNGSCMVIPRENDKVRVYIQLEDGQGPSVATTNGRVDKTKIGPEQLLAVAQRIFHPYSLSAVNGFEWWTIYKIGQRVASQFSVKDRVFIVGDACHTHSPKAGQGMNASMGDSHNLAWKITAVLRGWANMSLLRTYEFERRKYAQDLIAFDRKFAKLFSGKPRTEENHDGVSHEELLQIFQTFGGFTSGIGIRYGTSSITDTKYHSTAPKLAIGERIPPLALVRAADSRPFDILDLLPADSRFKVLVFLGRESCDGQQISRAEEVAVGLEETLRTVAPNKDIFALFDIVTVLSASRKTVRYNAFPALLRSHWSKIFVDETGGARNVFGIEGSGAFVVVRPDGYVGTVAPLESVTHLADYFTAFNRC
ncbi:hypothetical protein FA15DRAFT_663717 [Coprinopsis marcescibilis]|uniref:Phenol 2-monooxygenase n=1 Tax=Coprinopsis marcescibilis TaxID=230819 RepID=A0A5C3L9R6_COPMA|nr:hypothetical protein FA15DRAFT_663717 [Coprinopsis marcescibilis]